MVTRKPQRNAKAAGTLAVIALVAGRLFWEILRRLADTEVADADVIGRLRSELLLKRIFAVDALHTALFAKGVE